MGQPAVLVCSPSFLCGAVCVYTDGCTCIFKRMCIGTGDIYYRLHYHKYLREMANY